MSLPLFLQGFGSIGIFASRAFLPAFVTALLIRFGPQIPWLARSGLLPRVSGVPTWFTSDPSLVVLGLLAALELVAERFPEAKRMLDEVHGYLKAGMAALTYLGVLNASDRSVAGQVIQHAGLGDAVGVVAVAAGTYLATLARGTILNPLADADEDDDLGLQGVIGWIEDLWGTLGPVALIVFPLLTVLAFALAVGLVVAVEMRLEKGWEVPRVGCTHCGWPIHACALACPNCHAPTPEPRDVGFLGRPKAKPANRAALPDRLIAVKRCPACAERLTKRAVHQTCNSCGHILMGDSRELGHYVASIDRRVPLVCVACFVLGLVPILGVIPGVVLYRLAIVAPFRRYIPIGRGFLIRWGVRLASLLLVAIQWLPVAGGFALVGMALLNYAAYRSAYRSLAT